MPLTTRDELVVRRRELWAWPVLREVADRLARRSRVVRERPVYLPEHKALLSKDGGVCADDGSQLLFDPLQPWRHRCPRCGRSFGGERHHRAWIWRYHLWLSERAIHLALLHALGIMEQGARGAWDIVMAYAERYRAYPNRDNVLGPTRLFFSTYLESIWLTQIVTAASLMELAPAHSVVDRGMRGRLETTVEESAGLIASFDEGWSNRQAWNNTALVVAGRWLDSRDLVERGLDGPHGITRQLAHAVSQDGRWHEGENYHFFALRALSLAAEALRSDGVDLWGAGSGTAVLPAMFTAPLALLLPDLTLPARGDSPYGVSIVQPRFAELWEHGRARTDDPRLESLLVDIYRYRAEAPAPPAADEALGELGEVEQNRPPHRVRRDRLGWRALLWMSPGFPDPHDVTWHTGSTVVGEFGPVVLKTGAARYVGLECGHAHGGHRHPDLLHLTVYWDAPWLVDFGTGSYVSVLLHWYRSTLAHNAPGSSGIGQLARHGWCSGFGASGPWAWCRGEAADLFGPGTHASRTVLSGPRYVLDIVDVVPLDGPVDLAIHPLGAVTARAAAVSDGADAFASIATKGHEHGYDAVRDVRVLTSPVRLAASTGVRSFTILLAPRGGETVFLARGPSTPPLAYGDPGLHEFCIRRARGAGRWTQLYAASPGGPADVRMIGGEVRIEHPDGATETVRVHESGVEVETPGRRVTRLYGQLPQPERVATPSAQRPVLRCALLARPPDLGDCLEHFPPEAVVSLGPHHYRRSEDGYPGEEAFSAVVGLGAHGSRVYVAIDVRKRHVIFHTPELGDPMLDNEVPEIHADGVQCYVDRGGWRGYLALPVPHDSRVRVRPVRGTAAAAAEMTGEWRATGTGYRMLIALETGERLTAGTIFGVEVVVNEMRAGRERRAGQLALSGTRGWVYLRGDRESPDLATLAEVR